MLSCEISPLFIITSDRVRVDFIDSPVQQYERHPIDRHVFNIVSLPKIREIQDSVNRQGNSGVNEALRKRFLKMHTQDHQVVIPRTQFLIHPVDEVTEMEIMKIVHDNRDHPTAAGAQGRGRRVRNISHLVRSIPDQAARGLGNMLVTAKGS